MKPWIKWAGLVALLLAIDQASKVAVETLLPFQQEIPLIPFLSLFRTWNQGIAFSLLSGMGDVALLALTAAVLAIVLFLWLRTPPGRLLAHLGFAFICGGAIGNLIDRAIYGHVVDFILFHTPSWSFAVFNLADSFITVGAALVVLDELPGPWRSAGVASKDRE
jgi:signal peptidase II